MYVCIYLQNHVYNCIYIYTCMFIYTFLFYMYISFDLFKYIYICNIYIWCRYVHHTYVRAHVHTCMHNYITQKIRLVHFTLGLNVDSNDSMVGRMSYRWLSGSLTNTHTHKHTHTYTRAYIQKTHTRLYHRVSYTRRTRLSRSHTLGSRTHEQVTYAWTGHVRMNTFDHIFCIYTMIIYKIL